MNDLNTLFSFSVFTILILHHGVLPARQSYLHFDKQELIFSAQNGTSSKIDTLFLTLDQGEVKNGTIKLTGENAGSFRVVSPQPRQILSGGTAEIAIVFEPAGNFEGIARAKVQMVEGSGKVLAEATLRGLSTPGLEGANEATLSAVVEVLGYQIDLGWSTLANHTRPELQGAELEPSLFRKAGVGRVEMTPVARYSPAFQVPFGYYFNSPQGPEQNRVGILADSRQYPEHQTLFPSIASGGASFDPGEKAFGFFTISPSHNTYSEDIWNMLFYPESTAHATRVYAVKDKNGVAVDNTYLVCFEEAKNGDYQDYVFLVKNVEPAPLKAKFATLLNQDNLDGWYTFLRDKGKNNDPEHIFTVSDGVLHDVGKELGYLMTERSFINYHFKLEFKWGEKKWPPRDTLKRDSGICYHIPENEPDQVWPQSIECQIQEGDVGDFWLLGYSTVVVDGKQNEPMRHSRMVKKADGEKPHGNWNTVEVLSFDGKCVHIVNGVVVNTGENSSLRQGRILLQSEYAEIYYKNIQIREL